VQELMQLKIHRDPIFFLQLKNTLQTREFDQLKKKTSFEVIQKV
jgi:hypothetical protein